MAERKAKGHRLLSRWSCRNAAWQRTDFYLWDIGWFYQLSVDSKLSFLDETEIEALFGAVLLLPFLSVMFHGFMRVQIDLRCEREYRKKRRETLTTSLNSVTLQNRKAALPLSCLAVSLCVKLPLKKQRLYTVCSCKALPFCLLRGAILALGDLLQLLKPGFQFFQKWRKWKNVLFQRSSFRH